MVNMIRKVVYYTKLSMNFIRETYLPYVQSSLDKLGRSYKFKLLYGLCVCTGG